MRETISNEYLQISVLTKGAELCEIKSKSSGKDFLWNADPAIWGSHAPVLFPAIGAVKDGYVRYYEQKIPLPRHGFVRNNERITLVEKTSDSLCYSLTYDDQTWKVYPFQFEFFIRYRLNKNQIIVEHTIVNPGEAALYFSLGGHPAFKCPINEGESYSDYYLEFEKSETEPTWLLDEQGLVLKSTKPMLQNTKYLPLSHELFAGDALIFKNLKSKKVTLKSHSSTDQVQVSFHDFPYLGIWAKPNGDFVCIEPWQGIADAADTNHDLLQKEGMLSLAGKESYEAKFTIQISEGIEQ
ncbi:galactose mutarotase-like enzyme [Dyadobacter jejuensis]|uniref:Galactose mutarotase-like enzyme n=1 Tax=Dyadobacter jejuensis TaxID=1082580 RepID=A0A316AM67_9BACT|nr:aldose 1-epimerase family protein [Dyadobacter jejuensis]PWJ58875.1 galactose mutarotase-like enzyme [Dyadobacter jejuensis]